MSEPARSDHTRGSLFDPVFGAGELAPMLSDHAWLTALLDVEVANARVADLTARLLELSAELRDARKEAHALSLENAELQEALDALRSNKAYKTAERVWQLRRGLGL